MQDYSISYADWSSQEYRIILGRLLALKFTRGADISRLEAEFSRLYAPSTAFGLNFGRHALAIALDIFRQREPARDEVIIPSYICPSVVDAVRKCGLIPVPADVGTDLNLTADSAAAVMGTRTLAVIAPHMYACPAPIASIEALCRKHGVFLIDDAAQVVGVQSDGRMLGTYGDVGIISFAQSKTVITGIKGSGAVLLANSSGILDQIGEAYRNLPPASKRLGPLLDFVWNYLWAARTGQTGYYLRRIGDLLGIRESIPNEASKISNVEAAIALVQLARLTEMHDARLRTIESYHAALKKFPNLEFPQYAPGRFLARVMLALPSGTDLTKLRQRLKEKGLETRLGYAPFTAANGQSQQSEYWAKRLIGVPSGREIGDVEAFRICELLDQEKSKYA